MNSLRKPPAYRNARSAPESCLACGKRRSRYSIRVVPAGKTERLCAPCASQYLERAGQSGELVEISKP
jgi:hypothetical protein